MAGLQPQQRRNGSSVQFTTPVISQPTIQGLQPIKFNSNPVNKYGQQTTGLSANITQPNVVPGQVPNPTNTPTGTGVPTNVNTDEYFKQLANVESKGKYDAYNKSSGAYGKYQFIPSTEADMIKKMGITKEYARTPQGQEDMIKRFTADNRAGLIKAGYKPTNMNLWLAHNQGLGGAKAILSGGNVNMKNIRSNIPGGNGTVQDYLNHWKSRFGGNNQTYTPNKANTVSPVVQGNTPIVPDIHDPSNVPQPKDDWTYYKSASGGWVGERSGKKFTANSMNNLFTQMGV